MWAKGVLELVLRGMFGSKKEEVKGNGEAYITRRFMIYNPHEILFGLSNQEE
jgi:hypothetical protein